MLGTSFHPAVYVPVNVHTTALAEVDALRGTGFTSRGLLGTRAPVGLVDKHGLSGLQLLDGFDRNIKGCLYHGTFAGKAPLSRRPEAVRMPHGSRTAKSLRFR